MKHLIPPLLLAATLASAPAAAQEVDRLQRCGATADVLGLLGTKYGEREVATGILPDGNAMLVLTARSGTWTLVITSPRGVACMAFAGTEFEIAPPGQEG